MIKKIKEKIVNSFIFIFAIYFFTAIMLAGPYYTYKDIQRHDSFVRYIFVSPIVGYFKGVTWPYQYYFSKPSKAENESIVNFLQGNEYLHQAMNKMRAVAMRSVFQTISSNNVKYSEEAKRKELDEMNKLITLSRDSFSNSDVEMLNGIHNEFGHIRNQFLLVLNYYSIGVNNTIGMSPNLDKENSENNLGKADEILKEINIWMVKNLPNALEGFEPK
jgi:hypothetical protein